MTAKYVSVDLEYAEGLGLPQIIEIGAVRFDETGAAERWSTLVRPRGPLPYRVEQLTGLTAELLETAPPLSEGLTTLARFAGDLPLVGQSISLDLQYLERAGLRLTAPQYDTFELAQLFLPGLPNYDLRSIARALGIAQPEQHRALADAETAMHVFLALLRRLRGLPAHVLTAVNHLARGLDWPLAPLFQEAERLAQQREQTPLFHDEALAPLEAPPASLPEAEPPLVPVPAAAQLDGEALARALARDGAIAARLPHYEERPEQLAMLRAVADALQRGEHLLVEAGTGTGKSFAYLLPAICHAAATARPVVVSTNTINLQDQLLQKDLPTLAAALPFPFRAVVLKGRGNYLCLRRWHQFLRSEPLSPAEALLAIKVAIWLQFTRTGDRAELRLSPDEAAAWTKLAAHADTCTPARCPYHRRGTCFLARARAAAEQSHIVVVNHALLLSDLAARSAILPDYSRLIIDEAHHLEDEATAQFGARLTERDLLQLLDRLQAEGPGYAAGALADCAGLLQRVVHAPARVGAMRERLGHAAAALRRVRAAGHDLFIELHALLEARPAQEPVLLRLTPAVRQGRRWQRVEQAWGVLRDRWAEADRHLGELLPAAEELAARLADQGDAVARDALLAEEVAGEFESFLRGGETVRDVFDRVIGHPSRDEVAWLSLERERELTVHVAPLHVGERLWTELFRRKDAVVLTSATLTTADGHGEQPSFHYIRERLGLREVRELQLGAPFDYRRAALLCVPDDLPEPGQPYHQHRLVDTLLNLITALGGRTLVLFTSHGQLKQTYEALRGPLEAERIMLLGQNIDGSRARLLEAFRAGPRAVLLGTASFWEGVDVVGEALSCLVIARLPFSVPTDPVFAARAELFAEPFRDYAVPQAILRFKQGFGRLIRSHGDRGVCVVLDRRLVSKRYGRAFIASLPACQVRVAPARELPRLAQAWLNARPAGSVPRD
ncbi:MAG TPA: helicase C-terminal domain-containing protein [Chloroflexota bacterium]|nr:helicase C-terminal domain-containing protein [Chloroflexota bacterium]